MPGQGPAVATASPTGNSKSVSLGLGGASSRSCPGLLPTPGAEPRHRGCVSLVRKARVTQLSIMGCNQRWGGDGETQGRGSAPSPPISLTTPALLSLGSQAAECQARAKAPSKCMGAHGTWVKELRIWTSPALEACGGAQRPGGEWEGHGAAPPAAPLTVLSAELVARRKSSKGEKSKSVTRSAGEQWLTQAWRELTISLFPARCDVSPRRRTTAQGFRGDTSAHTVAG